MPILEIDWKPDARKLRYFSFSWLVAFAAAGLIVAWRLGCFHGSRRWGVPLFLWIAAASVGTVGALFPRAVKGVYTVWMALAFPVGWAVNYAALVLIYFGVMTPLAVLFRCIGRDPMHHRWDTSAQSYWVPKTRPRSARSYFRQF